MLSQPQPIVPSTPSLYRPPDNTIHTRTPSLKHDYASENLVKEKRNLTQTQERNKTWQEDDEGAGDLRTYNKPTPMTFARHVVGGSALQVGRLPGHLKSIAPTGRMDINLRTSASVRVHNSGSSRIISPQNGEERERRRKNAEKALESEMKQLGASQLAVEEAISEALAIFDEEEEKRGKIGQNLADTELQLVTLRSLDRASDSIQAMEEEERMEQSIKKLKHKEKISYFRTAEALAAFRDEEGKQEAIILKCHLRDIEYAKLNSL